MSISLDPVLELPAENEYEFYPGSERNDLLQLGTQWVKQMKASKKIGKRVVKAFGENISGHSVLLCRYLAEQLPPEDVCDL